MAEIVNNKRLWDRKHTLQKRLAIALKIKSEIMYEVALHEVVMSRPEREMYLTFCLKLDKDIVWLEDQIYKLEHGGEVGDENFGEDEKSA